MTRTIRIVAGSLLLLLSACGGGGGGSPPAPPPPPPPPPPARPFVDVTLTSGISYTVGITPRPSVGSQVEAVTVGGAAAGDCDGDGDIDIFITAGDQSDNRLYLNQLREQGNGLLFIDFADEAGIAGTRSDGNNDRHSGPVFADMDGDGDLDLFLGAIFGDPVKIYQNDGTCRFTDVTPPALVAIEAEQTISAAFGDYDLDGDLDMFLSHWGTKDDTYAAYPEWTTEHLWENRSDTATGTTIDFVNVSVETGVSAITRTTRDDPGPKGREQDTDFTFTPRFARMNADPWPDIAIAGDFGTSQLLLSDGAGGFVDSGQDILYNAHYGMGSSIGDIDNDGDLDWFISSISGADVSMTGNRLYKNLEKDSGTFALEDITLSAGIASGGWGWGSCMIDLDNDRDLDIYHVNGWPYEFEGLYFEEDVTPVFMREGGGFVNRSLVLGLDDGFSARGAICADFDEDGDIDILQLSDRDPNSGVLWENRSAAAGRNYLQVRLHGLAPNTEAAGARIYLTLDGVEYMREIMIGNNYISQDPAVQHFGLGTATAVEEIRVQWPARVPAPGEAPVQPPDTVLPNASVPTIALNEILEISQQP